MANNTEADSADRKAESQANLVLILSILPTTLSCISVALRLYTKQRILRSVGLDDYAILVAQTLAIGVAALNIIGVKLGGIGRHMEFVTVNELAVFSKSLLSAILIYNAAQIVTKISFLIQYRRLFPIHVLQKICQYGIAFLAIWGVAQQVFTAFSCDPGKHIFPEWKRCVDTFAVFNLNAVMNMVTDFIIFIIPIWPVLRLQINWQRKAYLLVVFCFGLLACAISIVRLVILLQSFNHGDDTWTISRTSYLSVLELSIGILCASVPTLRPLVKLIAPRLLGSSRDTSKYGQAYALGNISGARSKKARVNTSTDTGIYIQKEVEFHSTTELRSSTAAKTPYSGRERSTDGISLEIQGASTSHV